VSLAARNFSQADFTSGVTYSGVSLPNPTAALTDGRRFVNTPSYYLVNSGLTYTWGAGQGRARQSLRRGVFAAYSIGREVVFSNS